MSSVAELPGAVLRRFRLRAGLSQEELAERAAISARSISDIERGRQIQPHAGTVRRLAEGLALGPDERTQFIDALVSSRLPDDPASREQPATEAESEAGHAAPVAEERRLVTALFCDLAGLTSLSEPLDPEDVRDIESAYFSAIKGQVERYGGTAERRAGDSVLALFGIPVAHEDDPERAVLCALGMQGAMAAVMEELHQHLHARLDGPPPMGTYPLRVGINTGEVVRGPRSKINPMGAAREEMGVSGQAVNTAARLQALAEPGEILVGPETMRLTRSRVRYGDRRELDFRGRSGGYLVFPALSVTQGGEGLWQAVHETLPPAPFVGREREMAALTELWEHAQAGEGGLVSIVGEPGVGKSRLIAEFVSRVAGDQEARLVQGRCLSYGQEVSLWLIADLLRSIFSIDEDDTLDTIRDRLDLSVPVLLTAEDGAARLEARDVVGEVLGLSPSESMVTKAGADVRRKALIRGLRQILAALSLRGPTILVLQDLHWIDAASNELVGQVLVDAPSLRLLVLVAQREGWTPPWSDLGWPERINLRPLPEEEANLLAATVLGNVSLSADLERYLAERAGGNPFFVEELARSLEESGGLQERDGSLHLVPDVAHGLPTILAEVLQARLDRLEAPVKAVAQAGSVIGRSFAVRLLAEVVGETQSALEAPLRALQRAEIAFPRGHSPGAGSPELEYSFKHVTMLEVAYNTLVRKRRQELHLKTARAIAALYPSDEYVETIAFHYLRTDARAEAAEWLERAGDRAASVYANETAQTHYRNAIERLSKLDDQKTSSRVWEKLGNLLLVQSRYEEAMTAYHAARQGIEPSDRISLARVHRKTGDVWVAQRTFLDQALVAWDTAEAVLGEKPPATEAAWWREWLEIQLARTLQLYYSNRVDELAEVSERTRPVIEACATAAQRYRFFQGLALQDLRRSAYVPDEQTLEHANKSLEAAMEAGELGQTAWAFFLVGFTLLWHGDLDEAEDRMLAGLERAKRSGHAGVQSMCTAYLSLLYRKRGDVERVRTWNSRSLDAATEAQRTEYVAMVAANRAWLAWKEDNLPAAEAEAGSALTAWRSGHASLPFSFWWVALWVLIAVAIQQGRMANAIKDAGMLFGPDQAKVPDPLATMLHDAIEDWEAGDEETARTRLSEALGLAKEMAYL